MRIGIDVGGTHTDAVIFAGRDVVASTKVLTSANVRDGVVNALDAVIGDSGVSHDAVSAVMIGTTQFTNAVVERRAHAETAVNRIPLRSGELVPQMIAVTADNAESLRRQP